MLQGAIERAVAALGAPASDIVLERPREAGHGDLATSVALKLAKPLGRAPRQIAEEIVAALDCPSDVVSRVEIAGPGFINFWFAEEAMASVLKTVLDEGERFGRSNTGAGKRVNVEFVSANPTGPLHVGHGRGAALGDAIAALLDATGHDVTREFYVNDAGVQVDRMAESLWARVQQQVGRPAEIPARGYHGEYLAELAQTILEREGPEFADLSEEEGIRQCRAIGVQAQREEQDRDLEDFGVRFDVTFNESELYTSGAIEKTLEALEERRVLYERDDALWLKTSEFDDAKDRVLRKRDGTFTYFLPDIAYHLTKADRGATLAIDVWGADHHGYIGRMAAAMAALGLPPGFLRIVMVQLVRVVRHGEAVRFSKRSGEFVALRDLFEQTGVDAARYFFLMRRGDSQFTFDIDLAVKQTEENPVYYVQYAHTRIAGIFRNADVAPEDVRYDGVDLTLLNEKDEILLIKQLGEFPAVVERAAAALEPHRIVAYLEDLAKAVNGWYHRHRVIGAPGGVEQARLALARAAQIALANGLNLLGIAAPERM